MPEIIRQAFGLVLMLPMVAIVFNFFNKKLGCENSKYPPLPPIIYTAILVAMYDLGHSITLGAK